MVACSLMTATTKQNSGVKRCQKIPKLFRSFDRPSRSESAFRSWRPPVWPVPKPSRSKKLSSGTTITSVDRLANRRLSGFDLNDFETASLDDHLMSRTCRARLYAPTPYTVGNIHRARRCEASVHEELLPGLSPQFGLLICAPTN